MANGPFKQIDVQRAVKGAQAAGMVPSRIEVRLLPDGAVIVIYAAGEAPETTDNPCDRLLR
jgi:hypothetical protein